MGKKGMYGLEWADENTLKGEMPEKELRRTAARICKEDRNLFPDQVAILEFPVFERMYAYKGMDFMLRVMRSACGGGTIFSEKTVRIAPGPISRPIVDRINSMHGRRSGKVLLVHIDSGAAHGIPGIPLRKRVGEMIALAQKDIEWCKAHGDKLVKKYDQSIFRGVGRISSVRGRKK